jgi:hypothetical protein
MKGLTQLQDPLIKQERSLSELILGEAHAPSRGRVALRELRFDGVRHVGAHTQSLQLVLQLAIAVKDLACY